MSRYEITSELRRHIQDSDLTPDEKNVLLSLPSITKTNLIHFYNRCKPTATLLQLMKTTKITLENKNVVEPQPKSKEFLKSMEHLRLMAMEQEYQRLVNPKPAMGTLYEDKLDEEPYNPARAHKEVKSHITTMFNILISVASVVYAIWYWTNSSWKLRDSYRVLLCLFFGILILVAEVVVYMAYLNKIEAARVKERLKKEVKRVVKSYALR